MFSIFEINHTYTHPTPSSPHLGIRSSPYSTFTQTGQAEVSLACTIPGSTLQVRQEVSKDSVAGQDGWRGQHVEHKPRRSDHRPPSPLGYRHTHDTIMAVRHWGHQSTSQNSHQPGAHTPGCTLLLSPATGARAGERGVLLSSNFLGSPRPWVAAISSRYFQGL